MFFKRICSIDMGKKLFKKSLLITATGLLILIDNKNQSCFSYPLQSHLQIEQPQFIVQNTSNDNNFMNLPTTPEEIEQKTELPLTLKQAQDLGLKNNQQFQITLLQLKQSQQILTEVESQLYPSLGVQSTFSRATAAVNELSNAAQKKQIRSEVNSLEQNLLEINQSLTKPSTPITTTLLEQQLQQTQSQITLLNESLTAIENYATTTLDTIFFANYKLFSLERSNLIEAAKQTVQSAELEVDIQKQQLLLDISLAYYNVQLAEAQVRIENESVKEAKTTLQDADALRQAGLSTKLDVLNARINLASAQQRLVSAISRKKNSREDLARTLNLGPTLEIVITEPVTLAGSWDLTLEESIILAFQNRPELPQQLAQREASLARARADIASLLPQLNLQANYELLQIYNDDPRNSAEQGLGDGYSIGISLQWTFFDGGAAVARADQQETNAKIAEKQYSDLTSQIQLEVKQAYSDLQANQENLKTAQEALELAKEALRYSRIRFTAGVGTQTDVLDAENNLTIAENNLVTAILGYNQALVSLQKAVHYNQLEK